MLTFEEIDMLKHALTKEFEQICYHNGTVACEDAFMEMTEKLAVMLNMDEHLIDDVLYSGAWRLYQARERVTET
jgi:hypothetical protein